MTIFEEPEEHTICDGYLSALINDDYSSFDYHDEDPAAFDAWLADAQAGRAGHWSYEDDSENFTRDEVTGLFATCVTVTFYPIKS